MAKGIGNILAHGGRSEERTGVECDLDMDSLTTGTAFKVNCPNMTSGGKLLVFTTAGGITRFSIDGAGNLSRISGTSISDVQLNTTDLAEGQYVTDRPRRYSEFYDDFLEGGVLPGAQSGATSTWALTNEATGTTSRFEIMDTEGLGVAKCEATADNKAQIKVLHYNSFVNFANAKKYWFEARVMATAPGFYRSGYFIGLCPASGTLMALMSGTSTGDDASRVSDWIGFAKFAKSMDWNYVFGTQNGQVVSSGSSTPSVATGITNTWIRLGFSLETTGTTTSKPYVDGVVGIAPTEMTSSAGTSYPYVTALTIATGVSQDSLLTTSGASLMVDYIRVVQER